VAEAYQRLFHIVKQTGPWRGGGFLTRDKDVVRPANAMNRQKRPCRFTQSAPCAVAYDGVADLLGGGKSCTGRGPRRVPAARLEDDQAPPFAKTLGNKQKFAPHPKTKHLNLRRGV